MKKLIALFAVLIVASSSVAFAEVNASGALAVKSGIYYSQQWGLYILILLKMTEKLPTSLLTASLMTRAAKSFTTITASNPSVHSGGNR